MQQFLSGPTARARYWTRSFFGWGTFSACRPAASHESIARLQRLGWVANNVSCNDESGGGAAAGTSSAAAVGEVGGGIITQNVDRLHQAAGSRGVLELHGTTHVVRCLNRECGHRLPRARFQGMLAELNPEAARAATSDLLLVVGTSVQVFSAFRLVQACAESGGKIAIVNAGPTRADALGEDVVVMRLPCLAGETFARLAGHPSLAMPRPVGAASSAATRPK